MPEQLYWDDIEVGAEVIPLKKVATTQMLVKWAGASGDFNPLHYDNTFAESIGVSKPIVHGALKRQWLLQLATDWMGEQGTLKKFSCQYRAMDYPRQMKTMTEPLEGETWLCKGLVTKKYAEDSQHFIDCNIWIENGKGEITTPGKATIILPVRG
ncbi:MAG: MaoC/PaaZ C-terminal domain-containing protein [Dehalococcoidales bacterium]|nr:MaoC/PaaZ C-terminal domain-containing protein [Dehalococcoidales bacterium]